VISTRKLHFLLHYWLYEMHYFRTNFNLFQYIVIFFRTDEVAFINFDFSEHWGLSLTVLSDSLAQGHEIPVHGISVQASHQGD